MEPLIKEILEDLTTELGLKEESDVAVLTSKVKNAVREVQLKRNYPEHFSEDQIAKDLEKHYSNIRELALYDFNQYGVEGQTSHNENGTSRVWKDRKECFNGITAFCGTPQKKIVRDHCGDVTVMVAGWRSLAVEGGALKT